MNKFILAASTLVCVSNLPMFWDYIKCPIVLVLLWWEKIRVKTKEISSVFLVGFEMVINLAEHM